MQVKRGVLTLVWRMLYFFRNTHHRTLSTHAITIMQMTSILKNYKIAQDSLNQRILILLIVEGIFSTLDSAKYQVSRPSKKTPFRIPWFTEFCQNNYSTASLKLEEYLG